MRFVKGDCPDSIYDIINSVAEDIIKNKKDRIVTISEKTVDGFRKYPALILTECEIDILVEALKREYDQLYFEEKIDLLIPAKGKYIKNSAIIVSINDSANIYLFQYNWNVGKNKEFDGSVKEVRLKEQEYDRIGAPTGTYLSPIYNGIPYSCKARAIPYYIPENPISDSPAYHKYFANKNEEIVDFGIVASTFEKGNNCDGGADQIRLKNNKDVKHLLASEILSDTYNSKAE